MALYLVEEIAAETAPLRLVKAKSDAAALKHVATSRYSVTLVSSPMDAADLVASGVKVEAAGEDVETPAPGIV